MQQLEKRFRLHPLDLRDSMPPLQRPKLVVRDDYIFMILLYPVFDRRTRTIHSSEVDFFVSPNRLITVNADGLAPLRRIFDASRHTGKNGTEIRRLCFLGDEVNLLYFILSELLEEISPMLVHINNDVDVFEARLFRDFEKDLIQELLRIKTNVVNIRKAIQGHKSVIRRLLALEHEIFNAGIFGKRFERLVDQTKEIWDTLEIQKDTVNALHETNASLIDYRINEIMKTLTIFSVIVFPLTLLAAIFGMNAVNMPFVGSNYGFWKIIGLMFTGVIGMLGFFKYKKWL